MSLHQRECVSGKLLFNKLNGLLFLVPWRKSQYWHKQTKCLNIAGEAMPLWGFANRGRWGSYADVHQTPWRSLWRYSTCSECSLCKLCKSRNHTAHKWDFAIVYDIKRTYLWLIDEWYLYWYFFVIVDVGGGEVAGVRTLVWSAE